MIPRLGLALLVLLVLAGEGTSAAERTHAFAPPPEGTKAGLQGGYLRPEPPHASAAAPTGGELWFFTKEGRFSRSPQGGFDSRSFSSAPTARSSEGTYGIMGERLVLVMAGGSVRAEIAFARKPAGHVIGPIGSTPSAPRVTIERRESDQLVIGGIPSIRVRGFKAGARLTGEYGDGALAGGEMVRFYADGRFERRVAGAVGTAPLVSGTYGFADHTLSLTDAHGRLETLTVAALGAEDSEGRPEFLWCENRRWQRRAEESHK